MKDHTLSYSHEFHLFFLFSLRLLFIKLPSFSLWLPLIVFFFSLLLFSNTSCLNFAFLFLKISLKTTWALEKANESENIFVTQLQMVLSIKIKMKGLFHEQVLILRIGNPFYWTNYCFLNFSWANIVFTNLICKN